jgi:hypothetical protein
VQAALEDLSEIGGVTVVRYVDMRLDQHRYDVRQRDCGLTKRGYEYEAERLGLVHRCDRSVPDDKGGYTWTVTFTSDMNAGHVDSLAADYTSLTGTDTRSPS